MKKRQKYYVVWFGNPAGIFDSWKECQVAIKDVKGAQYKSFLNLKEAKIAFVQLIKLDLTVSLSISCTQD